MSIDLTLVYVDLSIRLRLIFYNEGLNGKGLTITAVARVCHAPIVTAFFRTSGAASSLVDKRVNGTTCRSFGLDVVIAHGDGDGFESGKRFDDDMLYITGE